jgi:hypothetical protein
MPVKSAVRIALAYAIYLTDKAPYSETKIVQDSEVQQFIAPLRILKDILLRDQILVFPLRQACPAEVQKMTIPLI